MATNGSHATRDYDAASSVAAVSSVADTFLELLNDANLTQIDVWLRCFFIPIMGALVVVGNTLSVIVLRQHGYAETSNILLVSLSVTDLIFSLSQLTCRLKCALSRIDGALAVTVDTFVLVYVSPFNTVTLASSALHVTAIAVNRLVAVCFPFQVSRIFTADNVLWITTFLYVYPTICLFRLTYEWQLDLRYNETVATAKLTQVVLDNFDVIVMYGTVVYNTLTSTVTMTTIVICSIIILIKLATGKFKTGTVHGKSRSKRKREAKVVKMLLPVCLVCLVVCLPSIVLDMYMGNANSRGVTGVLLSLGQTVNDILYQTNASANFIIYVTMSSKFARTYRKLFISKRNTNT